MTKGKLHKFEIETFYGVGHAIYRKLEEKLEKLENADASGCQEINYVIPPIQAVLYQKEIINFLKHHRKHKTKKIKIYTVDVLSEELVEITEFYRKIIENLKIKKSKKS